MATETKLSGQNSWYWNQSLNTESALLSGAVVAGESGIAAIFYNPATITEMASSNLSLSASLFSLSGFRAENALGTGFPVNKLRFEVQPRIITYTFRPKKNPELTIELAYFVRDKYYYLINQANSMTLDLIASNPGLEHYVGDFYYRRNYQDSYGGIGFGYKVSESFSFGFSGFISYKDDKYYNQISLNAFTPPEDQYGYTQQSLSSTMSNVNYAIYDVRILTKIGLQWRKKYWSTGINLSLPSLKLFGDGNVSKQYEYSNIHKDPIDPTGFNGYFGGRQLRCVSNIKDPLSIAAGINYYTPSGKSILLVTAEYFFGIPSYQYIEASNNPTEDEYDFSFGTTEDWLSFAVNHKAIFNIGLATSRKLGDHLTLSGGFRTDFNYNDTVGEDMYENYNNRSFYSIDIFHINSGIDYNFQRGTIIIGLQYSHGNKSNQNQIINLSEPVEYLNETTLPLSGIISNNVDVRYNDITVYLGFVLKFMNKPQAERD